MSHRDERSVAHAARRCAPQHPETGSIAARTLSQFSASPPTVQRHHDRKEPFDPTHVHALQANLLAGYRDPDCRCRGWRFRRDGQLARQGIQTSQFPNATFKLTQPIELGPLPPDGQTVNVTAIGDFTVHGVTKPAQIALQAKRSGTTIAVTGSLPVKFADYGVSAPNSFVVLSVDDLGTMEFQLLFRKG